MHISSEWELASECSGVGENGRRKEKENGSEKRHLVSLPSKNNFCSMTKQETKRKRTKKRERQRKKVT